MRRSNRDVRDFRPSETLEARQDYWIYVPYNRTHSVEIGRSMDDRGETRDPRWLFEEGLSRESNDGLTSLPSIVPTRPRPSPPLLVLVDEHDTYLGAPSPMQPTPPTYHQPQYDQGSPEDQESRLSPQEQKRALIKLRRQLYNPHINNIIKRMGAKHISMSGARSAQEDDDMKRCAVCLDDFESKQFVTLTPCNHMFHEDCIVPWVKSHGRCPVCRFVIF